jgi:hypothetical protein
LAALTEKNHCPKQIVNAADYLRCEKEPRGQHVKLADQTSNIGATAPAKDCRLQRRLDGIAWANTIIEHLPYFPKEILNEFLKCCYQTELNSYDAVGSARQAQTASIHIAKRMAKKVGADDPQVRTFMLRVMQGAL